VPCYRHQHLHDRVPVACHRDLRLLIAHREKATQKHSSRPPQPGPTLSHSTVLCSSLLSPSLSCFYLLALILRALGRLWNMKIFPCLIPKAGRFSSVLLAPCVRLSVLAQLPDESVSWLPEQRVRDKCLGFMNLEMIHDSTIRQAVVSAWSISNQLARRYSNLEVFRKFTLWRLRHHGETRCRPLPGPITRSQSCCRLGEENRS